MSKSIISLETTQGERRGRAQVEIDSDDLDIEHATQLFRQLLLAVGYAPECVRKVRVDE